MSRWDQPGVPHKGWTCSSVYDIRDDGQPVEETDYATCEMCGREMIRYVHVMDHPNHESLGVGCICAEKMSNDYVNPKRQEGRLKSKAGRKARWLSRKWKRSRKGFAFLEIDGIYITVFPDKFYPDQWKFCVGKNADDKVFSPRRYTTDDEAKLAAFETVWERLNEA